ncbi:MAG: hypothetical protein CVV36_08645 [Candidatus Methanoperedenaceae archaeon HGW-Methanoperedenaceae-1]|jgi:Tol biopolymer transport system component|nr:MAG: hypothetical protein CVV36_08645 [Candidatus Methanoperedenaceae archaeon HGW-Methanoperedenaceae-1]
MMSLPHHINRYILILFLLIILIPQVSAVVVTNITQLTYSIEIGYSDPSWSPDGSKIVYNYILGSNYSLWIMNANGSNPVPLTRADINNPVHRTSAYWVDSEPRWSSDGSKIVFQRTYYYDGGGYMGFFVYIINTDGPNQRMLISGYNPSISPDVKYIAFDAGSAGGIFATAEQGSNIFVMNVDGTNIKRLTDDKGNEVAPSWSPDGKKLVFTKDGTIYIMNADGSNKTSTGQGGHNARWSPDGKRIAFVSERAGDMMWSMKLFYIYVMDIDGSNVTKLTLGENRWDWIGDWSPNGTMIIFYSSIPPDAKTNLYTMTLDFNVTSPTATPTVIKTPTITQTATTTVTRTPGFSLLLALASIFLLILVKRSQR